MTKYLAGLLALIVALALAFGAGWHAKGISVAAATAKSDHQALSDMATDVNHQIIAQTAKLQEQQDASARFFAQQRLLLGQGADIRLEIEHAVFTPDAPLGIAPACPDPAGTAEFERLYNAAAKGGNTAPSESAGAGGVP